MSAVKHKTNTVVLLHGIGHSRWNMLGIAHALRKKGYNIANISYPSLRHNIQALTGFVHEDLNRRDLWHSADINKIHFVTHSMGGLIAHNYLETYKSEIPQDKLGRIVMLAPPGGGSEVADFLCNFPPYKWIFGPAGQELTTAAQNRDKAKPHYDLGIVAGSNNRPYIVANFVMPKQRHDGRVTVENTKLPGMKDHITLPATHSLISWKPSVHEQIVHFLKNGSFSHEP